MKKRIIYASELEPGMMLQTPWDTSSRKSIGICVSNRYATVGTRRPSFNELGFLINGKFHLVIRDDTYTFMVI